MVIPRQPGRQQKVILQNEPNEPEPRSSLLETQSVRLQASVFSVGTLVPLRTLWQFNGAGIGFPQRSCKAKARYVAKVLPSRQLGRQGGNNLVGQKNGVILQNEPKRVHADL